MQIAIIAGCFAFLGAVVGQLLSRNTQRETWLLQKRAEAFSKFYTDLEAYEADIFRIDDSVINESEAMKQKSYALEKLYTSASIVCLYLSFKDKATFLENLNSYVHYQFKNMSTLEEITKEFKNREQHKKNINLIFEGSLAKISWYQ